MENKESNLVLKPVDLYELNDDNFKAFPSAADLAYFSYAVYNQKFKSKVISDVSKSSKKEQSIRSLSDSWKLIATAESSPVGDGYHGSAYYDVRSKHLVIAHRGTEWTNVGALWADLKGILCDRYVPQMNSAYQFTRLIVDRFWECTISITVTGHSLGGWLSQTSAFFAKYPKLAEELKKKNGSKLSVDVIARASNQSVNKQSHHLHVVAFDSPGALNILEKQLLQHRSRYSDNRYSNVKYLNDLDITTYFSSPNAINSTNLHIGSLFMMPNITNKKGVFLTWRDAAKFLSYTFDSHCMKNIVKFWHSDRFDEKSLIKMIDWPKGFKETNEHHERIGMYVSELTGTKFLPKPIDLNKVRMSTFDINEHDFLEKIQHLKVYGVVGERFGWETMFHEKPMSKANRILSSKVFKEARNIFDFFDCFKIIDDSQVLEIDNRFKMEVFIRLVKYFTSDSKLNLPKLVKEVISELPQVYQAIYRAFSTEYLQSLPDVRMNDFTALQEFLESTHLKVYQAIAQESTLIYVAKIVNFLKSKPFSFGGRDVNAKFNMKKSLCISSQLLTTLDRHVRIARIVPPNDDLKLILIENSAEIITPTLHSLMERVFEASSPPIKLILVTSTKIEDLSMDFPSFYIEKDLGQSDEAILFENLSTAQQEVALNSIISFQGEDIELQNLISLEELRSSPDTLDQSTLIRILTKNNKISLGDHLNTKLERSYYIPRHFHKILLTEPAEFLLHKKLFFVISYNGIQAKEEILKFLFPNVGDIAAASLVEWHEWQGNFEGFIPEQHRVILVDSAAQSPNYHSFWPYVKMANLRGLWLIYDNNKWYWKLTFGELNVGYFRTSYEARYDEEEMLELQRPLVILSDEPGMGKSTLLKHLAEACKAVGRESGKVSWVIFVDLGRHVDLLKKTVDKFDSIFNFLLQISCTSSPVGECLLKYLLQQFGRVTIFFDGLDEVTHEMQSKAIILVKSLLDHTKANVLIASRSHFRSSLEFHFSSFINTLRPLDTPERIDFLTKFWIGHPDFPEKFIKSDLIKSYASRLLEQLEISINIMQEDSFIGIPLQLFMFSIIYLPNVCSFLTGDQSDWDHITDSIPQELHIFDNIFDLYRNFTCEKYRIYLEEKMKSAPSSERHPWVNRQIIDGIIDLHQISAFSLLFPNDLQVFDCPIDNEQFQVLLDVGIVQSDSVKCEFIHRSLTEYFAAGFLVSRLAMSESKYKTAVVDFLRNNIFHCQFDKIRLFLDHFISIHPDSDPVFRKCINWRNEEFEIFKMLDSSSDEARAVYDALGRNVLHYAVYYGDHNNGILWCLLQNQHLLDETDVFGYDFFSYMIPLLFSIKLNLPSRVFLEVFDRIHDIWTELDGVHPDLSWIIWFSGPKLITLSKLLLGRPTTNDIVEDFEPKIKAYLEADAFFNAKQIEKFMKIIKIGVASTPRDSADIISKIEGLVDGSVVSGFDMFCQIAIKYLKPEKLVKPFEMSMTTSCVAYVKMALFIYRRIRDLIFSERKDVQRTMLDVMMRNNFLLFKKCVPYIDDMFFALDLWHYGKEQRKEKEMFDVIRTTNFTTFRRALKRKTAFDYVFLDDCFKFCEELDDQNARSEMIEIVRESILELLGRKDFTSYKEFLFIFCAMWKFLPILDKERVVEKHYTSLHKLVAFLNLNKDFLLHDRNKETMTDIVTVTVDVLIRNDFTLDNNSLSAFCSMWNFLRPVDRELLLGKYYDNLNKYVITKFDSDLVSEVFNVENIRKGMTFIIRDRIESVFGKGLTHDQVEDAIANFCAMLLFLPIEERSGLLEKHRRNINNHSMTIYQWNYKNCYSSHSECGFNPNVHSGSNCAKQAEEERKQCEQIFRSHIDELFQIDFTVNEDELNIFRTLWNLLPIVDKENVLEKHYDTLKKYVITKIHSDSDSSHTLVALLCTICYSVGTDWQYRIESDAKIDLKGCNK